MRGLRIDARERCGRTGDAPGPLSLAGEGPGALWELSSVVRSLRRPVKNCNAEEAMTKGSRASGGNPRALGTNPRARFAEFVRVLTAENPHPQGESEGTTSVKLIYDESSRTLRDISGAHVLQGVDIELESSGSLGDHRVEAGDDDQLALGLNSGSDGAVDVGSSTSAGRAREDRSEKLTAVNRVWDAYCDTMQPRSRLLGDQERKIINAALKVASWEECVRAIKSCSESDFHMARGDHSGGKKYNRLSQILKGKPASPRGPGRTIREQVDFMLDLAISESESEVPSGLNASMGRENIRRAKREVVDAYEFPGDDRIVERGEKARELLAQAGIEVLDLDGSVPTFIAK